MVHLTRLNLGEIVVNADLIEHIESTPDTVITMASAQKFVVRESLPEVIEKVIAYRRRIYFREASELRRQDPA